MLRLRLAFGWYIGIFVLAAVLCLVLVNTLFQRMEPGMIPVTVGLGLLLTYIIYAGVEHRSVGLASGLSVVFGTIIACVAGVLIAVPGFFAWSGVRTGVLPALRQAVAAMVWCSVALLALTAIAALATQMSPRGVLRKVMQRARLRWR